MALNKEFPGTKNETCANVEVICGSMFSGKTEELIRRLNHAIIAKLTVQIFKPIIDTRYDEHAIVSHNGNSIPCIAIAQSTDILQLYTDAQVVAIDEAQFFDNSLPQVCNTLANKGVRVIVAGLDMDFKGIPFDPIPAVMAIAEFVTKLHAVCVKCGNPALYSYRIVPGDDKIMLGETESYEPRCRNCYLTANNPQ
ncbi:MAG: thymidine kinase [Sphingobacteriaceae bacterium]|nr:MAG: thymidine kinase [Sphingobacteriaceae bacterium]